MSAEAVGVAGPPGVAAECGADGHGRSFGLWVQGLVSLRLAAGSRVAVRGGGVEDLLPGGGQVDREPGEQRGRWRWPLLARPAAMSRSTRAADGVGGAVGAAELVVDAVAVVP